MTERQFQAKLLKALRAHPALKDAVIFKHTDMRNGGIPDVSITVNGNTTWFELKVEPGKCSKLQEYYIRKIGFLSARVVRLWKNGKGIDVSDQWGNFVHYYSMDRAVNAICEACS